MYVRIYVHTYTHMHTVSACWFEKVEAHLLVGRHQNCILWLYSLSIVCVWRSSASQVVIDRYPYILQPFLSCVWYMHEVAQWMWMWLSKNDNILYKTHWFNCSTIVNFKCTVHYNSTLFERWWMHVSYVIWVNGILGVPLYAAQLYSNAFWGEIAHCQASLLACVMLKHVPNSHHTISATNC